MLLRQGRSQASGVDSASPPLHLSWTCAASESLARRPSMLQTRLTALPPALQSCLKWGRTWA